MGLLARIEIDGSRGTLFVDLLTDLAQLVLFRTDMGLVHLQPAEIRHLAAVLYDVCAAWDNVTELLLEIDGSGGTLWVDTLTDPPLIIIWRTTAGLVCVELEELRHLATVLALPAWTLAALAEMGKENRGNLCQD